MFSNINYDLGLLLSDESDSVSSSCYSSEDEDIGRKFILGNNIIHFNPLEIISVRQINETKENTNILTNVQNHSVARRVYFDESVSDLEDEEVIESDENEDTNMLDESFIRPSIVDYELPPVARFQPRSFKLSGEVGVNTLNDISQFCLHERSLRMKDHKDHSISFTNNSASSVNIDTQTPIAVENDAVIPTSVNSNQPFIINENLSQLSIDVLTEFINSDKPLKEIVSKSKKQSTCRGKKLPKTKKQSTKKVTKCNAKNKLESKFDPVISSDNLHSQIESKYDTDMDSQPIMSCSPELQVGTESISLYNRSSQLEPTVPNNQSINCPIKSEELTIYTENSSKMSHSNKLNDDFGLSNDQECDIHNQLKSFYNPELAIYNQSNTSENHPLTCADQSLSSKSQSIIDTSHRKSPNVELDEDNNVKHSNDHELNINNQSTLSHNSDTELSIPELKSDNESISLSNSMLIMESCSNQSHDVSISIDICSHNLDSISAEPNYQELDVDNKSISSHKPELDIINQSNTSDENTISEPDKIRALVKKFSNYNFLGDEIVFTQQVKDAFVKTESCTIIQPDPSLIESISNDLCQYSTDDNESKESTASSIDSGFHDIKNSKDNLQISSSISYTKPVLHSNNSTVVCKVSADISTEDILGSYPKSTFNKDRNVHKLSDKMISVNPFKKNYHSINYFVKSREEITEFLQYQWLMFCEVHTLHSLI